MKLEEILEKKGFEGRENNDERIEEYSKRYHINLKNPEKYKKVLLKELKRMGFTQKEVEDAVGTSVGEMLYSTMKKKKSHIKLGRLRYKKWKEILVAKKEDAVRIDLGEENLVVLREVYRVSIEKNRVLDKYIKYIEKKLGVEVEEWSIAENIKAYTLDNEGNIEKKDNYSRIPLEELEEELKQNGVNYREYKVGGGAVD